MSREVGAWLLLGTVMLLFTVANLFTPDDWADSLQYAGFTLVDFYVAGLLYERNVLRRRIGGTP